METVVLGNESIELYKAKALTLAMGQQITDTVRIYENAVMSITSERRKGVIIKFYVNGQLYSNESFKSMSEAIEAIHTDEAL